MPHELTPRIEIPQPITRWETPPASDYSLAVHEILGRTPPWILRSGSRVVAVAVAALLFLSWLVSYPDMVRGKITITGINPAVAVVARQSGHLESLAVKEGQVVSRGHLLGVISNAADTARVLRLKEEVQKLRSFLVDASGFVELDLAGETELGPVQPAYGDFHAHYRKYGALFRDDYSEKVVAVLERQLESKRAELKELQQQVSAARREAALSRKNLERLQRLINQDAISLAEFQAAERQDLEQQRQHSMLAKSLLGDEIAAAEYDKQIREVQHKRTEELELAASELAESLKKLLAEIDGWENEFVLRAPIAGVVAFYDFWSDEQFVTQGKAVFIIAPEATSLLGRMPVAQGGAGKIKPGQIVRIKLDDYPAREFGLATGRVGSISLVAQQGQQLVSVVLDSPILSSYGKTIAFKQEMTGEAMVVTEERRLLERLLGEIRRAISQPAA